MYDAFVWNWSKNVVCDDVIFIAYCINDAIGDEIQCPITQEHVIKHKIKPTLNNLLWAIPPYPLEDIQKVSQLGNKLSISL